MASQNNDFINIPDLLRQYRSKWYLFVISIIVCVGSAALFGFLRQREYVVKANVLISPQKDAPMAGGEMAIFSSLMGSSAYVEDEIFLISSHSLYSNVTRDLGTNVTYQVVKKMVVKQMAYPEYPISLEGPAGIADTLRNAVRFIVDVNDEGVADIKAEIKDKTVAKHKNVHLPFTVKTPVGNFTLAQTKYYPKGESLTSYITLRSYDSAAEALDKDVNTEIASKRSNVISLSMNVKNLEYGKATLNEIIKLYNLRGIEMDQAQNQLSAKFIDQRLDVIAKELNLSEKEILDFKERRGIVDLELKTKYNAEKKGRIEEALLQAETYEQVVALTLEFLNDPSNTFSLIPFALENEGMQAAITQYNELILKRNELSQNTGADNLALKQLNERLALTRNNIRESVRTALNQQRVTVRDLRREMGLTNQSLASVPTEERDYVDLARQRAVKQELFVFLLQRREETAMLVANAFPKASIVDEAFVLSDPLGLGGKAILLIGFVLGLILPPIYLALKKLINNRFETRNDVERVTNVPILGEMCIDRSGNALVVTQDNTSAPAELFRLMRSNLLFILNDPRDKVVLITSSTSGEGKSFISVNLAASLALIGKKVLLVGMDIRNPRLAEYLNISNRFGLTQYLSSDSISIDQITNELPNVKGLSVICAGPVPPNPAELLISNKVDQLFAQLRTMYDYIIVDTAPIGLVSDTFTLDRIADASVYVCRANYTELSKLAILNEIYENKRLKKLSIAINGTAAKKTYGYATRKDIKG